MTFLTPEVREIALNLMEGLNHPRSLTVAILIRYEEWAQLVTLKCAPASYNSSDDYYRAVSATSFLKKMQGKIDGIDRVAAAKEKWYAAELQCFGTNRRLNEIADFGTLRGLPVDERMFEFLELARKNVREIIGDMPPELFDGSFGPGATISDNSRQCTLFHKLSSCLTLTPSALHYLVPWTGTKWASAVAHRGDEIKVVRGDHYFTVSKTATIDRSCSKQPSLNVYYQLGLGQVLRRRLKKVGIDLDDGAKVHRQVACSASLTGAFATIDLSSASDTVSTALVRLLLPPKWHEVLADLRTTHTKIDGKWVRLEKFSAMGNGFTFELETLIFTALAMTVAGLQPGYNLWVYGDDIIVPSDTAPSVIKTLEFFGFTTNEDKTFIEGPFRESCGGDYWEGRVVRPHFLKELPNEPQEYISLANGIRRLDLGNCRGSRLHPDLLRTWFSVLDQLPTDIRKCRGPVELEDLCIHDEESRWNIRWRSGRNFRFIRVYRPCRYKAVRFDRFDETIQYAAALKQIPLFRQPPKAGWPEFFDSRTLVPRDGVTGYKLGWALFS